MKNTVIIGSWTQELAKVYMLQVNVVNDEAEFWQLCRSVRLDDDTSDDEETDAIISDDTGDDEGIDEGI